MGNKETNMVIFGSGVSGNTKKRILLSLVALVSGIDILVSKLLRPIGKAMGDSRNKYRCAPGTRRRRVLVALKFRSEGDNGNWYRKAYGGRRIKGKVIYKKRAR